MVRSSRIQLRQISGVLFLGLLVSPFLVLLAKIPGGMDLSQSRGLLWALQNSVLQALGSALLAVVAGGAIALGLLSQAPNAFARVACEKLLIAPALLPTLFSLVLCLSIIDPFPFGILGIAIVHAFINMGLVGVSLAREMERDLAGMSQVAWLEGASRGLLLKALRQPLFHKLRTAFFFVFTICFSSFTVPLMVGGGRGTTLEVLIYEKIRIEGNLNTALGFSLLQSALVLLFSFWFLRQSSTPFLNVSQRVKVIGLPWLFWLVSICAVSVFGDLLSEGYQGWQSVQNISGLWEQILDLTAPSLLAMLFVVVAASVLFVWQLSQFGESKLQRLAAGMFHLSPSLIGFAFLLLFGDGSITSLVFALTLLFYTSLWRLFAHDQFQSLQGQWEMAGLLGASRWQTLWEIIWPQMRSTWLQVVGVLSVWTLGEYAISKLVLGREATLGILAGNLMSSYRIQASVFVVLWILFLGLGSYLFFSAGAYVSGSKSS